MKGWIHPGDELKNYSYFCGNDRVRECSIMPESIEISELKAAESIGRVNIWKAKKQKIIIVFFLWSKRRKKMRGDLNYLRLRFQKDRTLSAS